jgi:outer membrane autotransporter protein
MKKIFAIVVGATVMAMTATSALAQSSVSDDQGQANNLVTTSVTPTVSSTTVSIISTGISNAISLPAPSAGTVINTGDAGRMLFNTRALASEGEAAGEMAPKMGVWVQMANTWVDGSDPGGEFEGDAQNITAGLDYKVTDGAVVGVALGYELTDIDTTFNNGTFEGNGITISPYVGVNLNKTWSLSALVSYGMIEYDNSSNNGATTGSFDATRLMGSASIEGNIYRDALRFSPKASVMYLSEDQDGYTDSAGTVIGSSTIDLGRAAAGATVGYRFNAVEPYARAMFEYDFSKEDPVNLGGGQFSSDDKFGVNAALGANFGLSDNLSGNIEGNASTIGRENLDVYTISGRLRYQF